MGCACPSWHCLLIPCSRPRKHLLLWALRHLATPAHMSLSDLLQPQLQPVYDCSCRGLQGPALQSCQGCKQ